MDGRLDVSRLEWLFGHRHLSRGQFIAGLVATGMTASGIEALVGSTPEAQAQVAPARYLVLIVLDAFRTDYLSMAAMPTLQALIQRGVFYDRAWVAQLESETPTGHATISRGSLPKRDGVIGFEWWDPGTHREVLDGWPKGVLARRLEHDLNTAVTSSIPHAVKVADRQAKVVALSSEKVYAADAMGGEAADYVLYHQRLGPRHDLLVPGVVPGHAPPPEFLHDPNLQIRLPMKHFTDWDYLSGMLALMAFDVVRPTVLMVNLPGADVYGHPYGGPATPAVMEQVITGLDRNISRIVTAYQRANIYDQTLFVVTADHGMVPNDRGVPIESIKAAVSQGGGQYLFHTGGTAAYIYLADPATAGAVATQIARIPEVTAAFYQTTASGVYEYVRAPGPPIDPELEMTYQYLVGTFSGPTAPDVVAPFRENTISMIAPTAHGDHGGLNWGAQAVPLVFAGPGVRAGMVSQFPARLTDVAPTVLRLLGIPPRPMDGIILADALAAPTALEISNQVALAPSLTAYQNALIATSQAEIAEDQKQGHLPPPPRPLLP